MFMPFVVLTLLYSGFLNMQVADTWGQIIFFAKSGQLVHFKMHQHPCSVLPDASNTHCHLHL